MILCETDYRRALEELRRYGEELLSTREQADIQVIEDRQYTLIREICNWIHNRPRDPARETSEFLAFLVDMEERCALNTRPRRGRGNRTNHPLGRRRPQPSEEGHDAP